MPLHFLSTTLTNIILDILLLSLSVSQQLARLPGVSKQKVRRIYYVCTSEPTPFRFFLHPSCPISPDSPDRSPDKGFSSFQLCKYRCNKVCLEHSCEIGLLSGGAIGVSGASATQRWWSYLAGIKFRFFMPVSRASRVSGLPIWTLPFHFSMCICAPALLAA